jgi:prepilin-type N-terminal cleavage/methylation domain-containing protein
MSRRLERGFSYIEVLVSVVLLGVLLVPALEALQSGISGTQAAALAKRQLALRDKMERVLAKPFVELYAQTYAPGGNTTSSVSALLSDPVGTPDRRAVVLYRANGSGATLSSADTGLLYVAVYYERDGPGSAIATLVGRWW